ncbi:MAG: acetyl-CoA carboxylase biotin carboxyl carrier protein subunit [Peptoniphilus sp.]|nr:acetyl-CoA carboxylase biotin carboxyl carrier protein subunit [Peptoniphilus sp.]MDY3118531.1 acetyl-CoA carboxylase biotin carboxyl carrier protein subunit [Peptoniphilus sp.]
MILRAPLPGKILRRIVPCNENVDRDGEILAMESMKMEILLPAPVAGVVRYEVKEGDCVARGEILARIDPDR